MAQAARQKNRDNNMWGESQHEGTSNKGNRKLPIVKKHNNNT